MVHTTSTKLFCLFGSQTGNSQSIAKKLEKQAQTKGFECEVMCLNQYQKLAACETNAFAAIVCSTTGHASLPENAMLFADAHKNLGDGAFAKVSFAVLALGHSAYPQYCAAGKQVHGIMRELGASEALPMVDIDAAENRNEGKVDRWLTTVWNTLDQCQLVPAASPVAEPSQPCQMVLGRCESCGILPSECSSRSVNIESPPRSMKKFKRSLTVQYIDKPAVADIEDEIVGFSRSSSTPPPSMSPRGASSRVAAVPVMAQYLTSDSCCDRSVLQIRFDLQGEKFTEGDSICITPENDSGLVDAIIERLGYNPVAPIVVVSEHDDAKDSVVTHLSHIPRNTSAKFVLTSCCDITSPPTQDFLHMMAELATNSQEKKKLEKMSSNRSAHSRFVEENGRPNLLDVLDLFPSCNIPIDDLLEHLPPLQCRKYTIASSSVKTSPDGRAFADIFVTMVSYKTWPSQRVRKGVASSYLQNLCQESGLFEDGKKQQPSMADLPCISVSIEHNPSTTMPAISDFMEKPVIMVGPGTGIAPFHGWMDRLAKENIVPASTWLLFGCRHKQGDVLKMDNLQRFLDCRALSRLDIVSSRDSSRERMKYVQHVLQQNPEQVYDALCRQGGYMYVCGDGSKMVKDVEKTVVSIIRTCGNMTNSEAEKEFANLKARQQFVKSVWF